MSRETSLIEGCQFASNLWAAAFQDDKPNLAHALELIVKELDSFSCIVWEEVQPSHAIASVTEPHLYTLAAWYPQGASLWVYDLPIEGTVSGNALRSNQPIKVHDVQKEGGPKSDHPFVTSNDLGPICSVPIAFHDSRRGTFDLHRKRGQPDFTDSEIHVVQTVANLLPQIYRGIRNKTNLELVTTIENLLPRPELAETPQEYPAASQPITWEIISNQIAKSLRCREVSIVLKNQWVETGNVSKQPAFSVMTSTWKQPNDRSEYSTDDPNRKTDWVIRNKKPIRLFDLARVDKRQIGDAYLGLIWREEDSQAFIAEARKIIVELNQNGSSHYPPSIIEGAKYQPPISFMAVPLLNGGIVVGVIRCSTVVEHPHFFIQRDLELLEIVAALVASWYGRSLILETMQTRFQMLKSLARLNASMQQELSLQKVAPNQAEVVHQAMQLAISNDREESSTASPKPLSLARVLLSCLEELRKIARFADIIDIRLHDTKANCLRFVMLCGDYWDRTDIPTSKKLAMKKTFPVSPKSPHGMPRSAGERVVWEKKSFVVHDAKQDSYFGNPKLILAPKQALVVPILLGETVFGVLDIISTSRMVINDSLQETVELVGTQLGLYFALLVQINKLQENERHISESFEELTHQLKTPVVQCMERAGDIHRVFRANQTPREIDVLALRGLCRKTLGVMRILGFSVDLQNGKSPKVGFVRIWDNQIQKLLEEAAFDFERVHHRKNTQFNVDRHSLVNTFPNGIQVDQELFEQVVFNLFDNAIKYSGSNQTIYVKAARNHLREQYIEIANQGIRLTSEDAKSCINRGWRGAVAKTITSDGSGLGLYLVDNIMKAMRGRLEVQPTDSTGWTRARIYLWS